MTQLFTVCVWAVDAEIQPARELSLEWIRLRRPSTRQTVEEMLPTPLTPIGGSRIIRWLCTMTLTADDITNLQAFIQSRPVPVVAEVAGEQDDSLASRTANRDRWLAANGLAVANS